MFDKIPKSPSSHKGFSYIKDMGIAQKIGVDNQFGPPGMKAHLTAISQQSELDLSALILIADNALFFMSGERHAILKQSMLKIIGPGRQLKWQWIIDESVNETIKQIKEKKECNLIDEFTYPIYRTATQQLLGIFPKDPAPFEFWVPKLQELLEPLSPIRVLKKMEAVFSLLLKEIKDGENKKENLEGFTPLLKNLLENPIPGFTSDDIYAATLVLYGASLNVSQTLGNIIYHILSAPANIRLLAKDSKWVKENLEYLIKIGASPRYVHRISLGKKELDGFKFEKGDNVLFDLPEIHTRGCPFNKTIEWSYEKHGRHSHLSFGKGIHYCVGAGYARSIFETAIPALFNAFPGLELIDEKPMIFKNSQALALEKLNCKL